MLFCMQKKLALGNDNFYFVLIILTGFKVHEELSLLVEL